MFAKLSDTIARSFVARGTISEERFSICRYGIKQLFSVCLNLLTTLCIGMVFGLVWESVLFTAAYIPLRSFAGGFHAKTPVRCYWYSAAMIAIVLVLLRFVPLPLWTAVPVYMISSILLWLLAPVETSHKPLDELEQRGIIGPHEGSKPRKVLMTRQQWMEMSMNRPDDGSDTTD